MVVILDEGRADEHDIKSWATKEHPSSFASSGSMVSNEKVKSTAHDYKLIQLMDMHIGYRGQSHTHYRLSL
jgi:hypothetical protein